MNTGIGSHFGNHCGNALGHDLLWIGLTGIDYVVNPFAIAKDRSWYLREHLAVWLAARNPGYLAIFISAEWFVIEVESEMAELPQLVRDILSRVGYGAV